MKNAKHKTFMDKIKLIIGITLGILLVIILILKSQPSHRLLNF